MIEPCVEQFIWPSHVSSTDEAEQVALQKYRELYAIWEGQAQIWPGCNARARQWVMARGGPLAIVPIWRDKAAFEAALQ